MLYYSCLSDAQPEVPRQHLWGRQTDLKPGYTDFEILSRVERKLQLPYPYSEHGCLKPLFLPVWSASNQAGHWERSRQSQEFPHV